MEGVGIVHPRDDHQTRGKKAPYFDDPSTPGEYGGEIPLYSICCLELFNHIAEGASYRTCAKEGCTQFFVRQQGDAKQTQYRLKGVMYCSHACKSAQMMRDHRRRKKAKRRS